MTDDLEPMAGALGVLRDGLRVEPSEPQEPTPYMSHAQFERENPRWAGAEPCSGMLIVEDQAPTFWVVCCEECGFQVSVPLAKAAPERMIEYRLARARLPEGFAERPFERTADTERPLAIARGWLADFPKTEGAPALAFYGEPGRGKALDVATPILTPGGWRTMLDLRVGDQVYGADGRATQVQFVSEVQLGRDCFEVRFSDGAVIVADAEHLWTISTHAARKSMTIRNAQAGKQLAMGARPQWIEQSEKWTQPSTVTTRELAGLLAVEAKQPSIPCAAPIEQPAADLPIDPYVLGVWLGDGDARAAMVTAHVDDAGFYASQFVLAGEMVGEFDADHRRPHIGRFRWGYRPGRRGPNPAGGHARLRALGLLGNKHIPERYLRGAISQRLALLQGLVDSDGHVQANGRVEIVLTREALAVGVLELARGLGLRATLHESAAKLEGVEVSRRWRIQWTSSLRTARLPRKAERLARGVSTRATHRYVAAVVPVPSRPVKCIQVAAADRLYLAGRELIATHNTHLLAMVCRTLVVRYGVDVLYRSAIDLFDELQASFDDDSFDAQWERLLTVPVLALDDLGSERKTDWREERLAQLVDRRYRAQRPILLASNHSPEKWADEFGDRSASRLKGITTKVRVDGPDRRAGMGQQQELAA